jgi:SAM-dependent methyltransferase
MRERWNERYRASGFIWSTEPNRFLVEEVAGLEPGRALDLGCGEGRNAIWLAEQGWDVTAVDFSDVAIEKGQLAAAKRGVDVRWIVADITEYVPESGAYDLVLVAYVHLPPDQMSAVWRRAVAAVAPGGMLLVIGHHSENLERGIGGPQNAVVLYDEHHVVSQLEGLEIERAEAVVRPVERDGAGFEAIDVLVRARRSATR